jgi:PAS domain S-box-containing protein
MMADTWLTISQIEEKTKIPNRTIRRYMEQHSSYLEIKKLHKNYMFSADSLPVLIKIRQLYASGLTANQVNEVLAQEHSALGVTNYQDEYDDTISPEISGVDYHCLNKSKTIFHELFKNAHDIFLLASVKTTRFVEVNNMACEKLGFSDNEFLEMSFMDIIDKEINIEHLLRVKKNCIDRGYDIIDTNYISKSGNKVPVEIKICLIEFNGEKFSLSVARDITDRKND